MQKKLLFFFTLIFCSALVFAQPITGVWKGNVGNERLELKLIKSGDSLVGTSYYYQSKNNYRRYSVKGYFDPNTNDVIWWDDVLIENASSKRLIGNLPQEAYLYVADFNCPGDEVMKLEGNSSLRDDKNVRKGLLNMQKVNRHIFDDEWDYVIENYTVGTNDPELIDSIATLHEQPAPNEELVIAKPLPSPTQAMPIHKTPLATAPADMSIDNKFTTRTNKLQRVIPVSGKEKIELRFYDNAEVDGDSIALFLNGKLIFKNIRLTDQAYTVTLNATDLQTDNELVMVAENLGSIPPNTSYMVAIVGNKRYEARLYANEQSSALIRIIKQ